MKTNDGSQVTYEARFGCPLSNSEAQEIGPILEQMVADKGGTLRPKDVVEAAKDPTSPLHGQFTWEDTVAANAYRLDQARRLIGYIVVTIQSNVQKEPVQCRVFHSVKNQEGKKVFVSLTAIKDSTDMQEQIIAQALRELIGWNKRYGIYKEFSSVGKAIEQVEMNLSKKKSKKHKEDHAIKQVAG